ncbi:MAG: DUF4136 domain-containing protein [Moritella sp.]|uniref:DUF4136 domain-containing protein n=1 Tax=Moritella sp. TaxID=78556 RepID=UPI0025F5D122|nr:DUF4136 domain-containing protein [Moritella sp.]NQZ93531.1 DUF4136 domain-containing protein [Moritella sp.]
MIKQIIPFILMFVLAGCTTTEYVKITPLTKIVIGDLTNFAQQQHTFAWYPNRSKTFLPDSANKTLFTEYTQGAITQIMQNKGYTLVDEPQQADFLIGYGLAIESELSDEEIFAKVGNKVGLVLNHLDPTEFQKGSAFIAFYQPQTLQPQWQVLAQGIAKNKVSTEERKKNIYAVMYSMLNKVPTRVAK